MIKAKLTVGRVSRFLDPSEHYPVYDAVMRVTGSDHEKSANAAAWCELASIGETYDGDGFSIEIEEV